MLYLGAIQVLRIADEMGVGVSTFPEKSNTWMAPYTYSNLF